MIEIKLSIYGAQPSPLEDPAFLLSEFQTQQHVSVSVSRLKWDEAWPQLLNYAVHGDGPHVSHIGAIWTSTLVAIALARFLSSSIAQRKYATASNNLPARSEAVRNWRPELAAVNAVCPCALIVGWA